MLPVMFYSDWPAMIPNNHLADVKQFTLMLSKDDESGNWGLFNKAYEIQIDAYFSQQIGLQTIHCYVVSGGSASCNAVLSQNRNHIDVLVDLQQL